MVTLVFRTDVHVADRSPASWKGDYAAEVLSSLEQIGELARRAEADAVLDGGDFFHVKAASKNSHGTMRQVIEIHKKYPCPVFSIEGNHDLQYNNLETLEKQPLGVLFAAGVFEPLRETIIRKEGEPEVRVVGVPYSPTRKLDELQAISKQGEDCLVAVVHALATETPHGAAEGFVGEPVFRYRDLVFPGGPDIWLFGHWHKDQGITMIPELDENDHQVREVTFVNQGAVSRGALNNDNLDRTPKVAVLEIQEGAFDVRAVELVVPDAEEVFDLERKARQDHRDNAIEQFVDRLMQDGTLDPGESVDDAIDKLEFALDVRDGAREYLERARESRR